MVPCVAVLGLRSFLIISAVRIRRELALFTAKAIRDNSRIGVCNVNGESQPGLLKLVDDSKAKAQMALACIHEMRAFKVERTSGYPVVGQSIIPAASKQPGKGSRGIARVEHSRRGTDRLTEPAVPEQYFTEGLDTVFDVEDEKTAAAQSLLKIGFYGSLAGRRNECQGPDVRRIPEKVTFRDEYYFGMETIAKRRGQAIEAEVASQVSPRRANFLIAGLTLRP